MSRFLSIVFYSAAAVAVAAALLVAWLNRFSVEIPASDETMRPAIGPYETNFDVDAEWLDAPRRDTIVAFMPPDQSTWQQSSAIVSAAAPIILPHSARSR